MSKALHGSRQPGSFIPSRFRSSVTGEAVFSQHIEVTNLVARERKRSHLNAELARRSHARRNFALSGFARTTWVAEDHVRKRMTADLLRNRARLNLFYQ